MGEKKNGVVCPSLSTIPFIARLVGKEPVDSNSSGKRPAGHRTDGYQPCNWVDMRSGFWQPKFVLFLIWRGALIDPGDVQGFTALLRAAQEEQLEVYKALFAIGALTTGRRLSPFRPCW
ncbi:hypothetical protein GPALN_002238 [Globodera pallida]|nr:hypothetical protein GPALN_002238 [Globodera pallida]